MIMHRAHRCIARGVLLLATYALAAPGMGGLAAQEALDWGGSLSSSSSYRSLPEDSSDDPLGSTQTLTLFLTSPLGAGWSFVGQAAARQTLEPVFAADVEKLYLQYDEAIAADRPGGLLAAQARLGRFSLSEPTGQVLRHTVDGFTILFDGLGGRYSLGWGYIGFLNKEFSSIQLSERDSLDAEDTDRMWAAPRLLAVGSAEFPALGGAQRLALGLVAQTDLRNRGELVSDGDLPSNVSTPGGYLNTQYLAASLDGPLGETGRVFYRLGYVFNTGSTLSTISETDSLDPSGTTYRYRRILAHGAELGLDWFGGGPRAMTLRVAGRLGSGDSDYDRYVEGNTSGYATQYLPVTGATSGLVMGLEAGNATTAELGWSIRPFGGSRNALRSLQLELSGFVFLRTSGEGPVSASRIDAERSGAYLGSELNASLRWRPTSDLGIGLSGGYLVANPDVVADGSDDQAYLVRLDASLSF